MHQHVQHLPAAGLYHCLAPQHARHHRITEWPGSEGTSRIMILQPPTQMRWSESGALQKAVLHRSSSLRLSPLSLILWVEEAWMILIQAVTYNIFEKRDGYVDQGVECSDPDQDTIVHRWVGDSCNSRLQQVQICAALCVQYRPVLCCTDLLAKG